MELKKGRKGVGAELGTHAAPCTRPPPARRGAVPGCTARRHCASGRGAHTRPRRPAARSALGRRSAAPRRRRAARPEPTGPRPPGGAGRPHAPADSRRALRGGSDAERPAGLRRTQSGHRAVARLLALFLAPLSKAQTPLFNPENGSYPLSSAVIPPLRPETFDVTIPSSIQ